MLVPSQPTVIVTLVGTNDLWPDSTSITNARCRFSGLLSSLETLCPDYVTIVSFLLPNNNSAANKKIDAYNAAITAEINGRDANQGKLLLKDGNECINMDADLSANGTHPNDVGYAVIEYRITEQILLAGRNGWLGP